MLGIELDGVVQEQQDNEPLLLPSGFSQVKYLFRIRQYQGTILWSRLSFDAYFIPRLYATVFA